MIKYNLFIAVILLLFCACRRHNETIVTGIHAKKNRYHVDAFRTDSGWGYTIRVNNKPYIRQSILPSVEGNKPITSKAMAVKLGNLVMAKMKNQESPAITRKDLEVLGISPVPKGIAP